MKILGHRDPRMTIRYQHVAPVRLRDATRAHEHAAVPAPAAVEIARWALLGRRHRKHETQGGGTLRFEMVDDAGLEPATPGM